MTYDLSPDEPPVPPGDSDVPMPGRPARRRRQRDIDEDLGCIRCGYNLRGLPGGHRCPECGTPAVVSLAGDVLQYAPPAWLKRVRNGLALVLCSFAADVATIVNAMVTGPLARGRYGHLLEVISALLLLVGVVLMTTPEPRLTAAGRTMNVRRWLRVAAFAWCCCSLTALFSPSAKVAAITASAGMLVLIGIMLGVAVYLRRFAERIPDHDLERSTVHMIWGFAVSIGVFAFFSGFSALFAGQRRIIGPAPCIAVVAGASACFFAVWFLVLIYHYYLAIRWAVHEARVRLQPRSPRRVQGPSAGDD